MTEALGAVSKERDGLANELEHKAASVLIAARAHSTEATGLFG